MKNEIDDEITSQIRIEQFISEGTYGKVYKGRLISTNEIVAIKEIKIELDTEGISSTSLREIGILNQLKHPNIVKYINFKNLTSLKQVICSDMKLYMIFDYLDIDLKKFVDERDLNQSEVKLILYQILEGIVYCHNRKVLHRDLKPQNILIKLSEGVVKLADFGLARIFSIPRRPFTKEVITIWYRCPEILMGLEDYGEFVDMWSVGCIFAEIAKKSPLFNGENEVDQLNNIFE